MKITCDIEKILLNVIRPCEMRVPLSRALNMNGSMHLIIDNLLRSECKGFEV